MKNRQICLCNGVTEKEILQLVKKGAKNMDEVRKFTLATTGCGKCKFEVEALLKFHSDNKQSDLQYNIEF
ncbi:MAG: (2Fe-2S)-binding protein [Bacteroidetes bacterium]|nr:(2Fe-2S)-binding protein [Bacteroidota bacterium]MCL6102315.1 (2Fe-2S)-binding protein [Bacteroidota bacterium]